MRSIITEITSEQNVLQVRLTKLDNFLAGENSNLIPKFHKKLLVEQQEHMAKYLDVLNRRIKLLKGD